MAQKRMFSSSIIHTDDFMTMPLSSQALYFHLGMESDDEGVVSSAKMILRMIGASEDDLKLLIIKGFLINLDNKLFVVTHWYQHNTIQADRRKKSIYSKALEFLTIKDKTYIEAPDTKCIQDVSKVDTQYSIDKYRIEENRRDKNLNQSGNPDDIDKISEIIDFFNKTTGQHCKVKAKKNQSLIRARFVEGATIDEFKIVIEKMYKAWNGTEQARYIRPETLFGNKFDGYLNGDFSKTAPGQPQHNSFTPSDEQKQKRLDHINKNAVRY